MTASASAMYTDGGVALCSPCKSELCYTDGGVALCSPCKSGLCYTDEGAALCSPFKSGLCFTGGGVALCSPCESGLCYTDGGVALCSPCKNELCLLTEELPSAAHARVNSAYRRRSRPLQPIQEWTLLTNGGVALCKSRPRISLPIPKALGTGEKIQLSMNFFSKIVRRFLLHFLITDKLVLITLPRKM